MKIPKYIKSHSVFIITITVLAIIIMVIFNRISSSKKSSDNSLSNIKQVNLVDVKDYRDDISNISTDGVVESVSQVDIKSQVSAPISKINFSIGDYVNKGQIIIELQNADIRAQLEQAYANLELVKGQYSSGDTVIDSTKKSVIDRIKDAYTKTNDIVNAQIGQFLYNGNPYNFQLQSFITDYSIGDRLSSKWSDSLNALRDWKNSIEILSDKSSQIEVDKALSIAQKSISIISDFIDILSEALVNATNSSNQTTLNLISTWKTTATLARTNINTSISSLTSSGLSIVTNQAQILSAEAGIKNLKAQLAKTIIISPINGKIASLPLRVGEFSSLGQLLTTIVGEGGLQIKAYASSEDLDRIQKDANVNIQDNIKGIVTSVAPSVNQINKKVEIIISIKDPEKSGLVVGQNIRAFIQSVKSNNNSNNNSYIIPIQNVKIIPGDAYVFTIDNNSKVIKNRVILGEIKGDFVEIKSGITDDMKIISPVYELEEGEKVKIE